MRPTLSSLGATSAGGTSEGERFSGLPPLASRSTTSATTTSPTPPSSGRSVWNGSSRASRRFTDLVRPISCCATSIAAHSKSMTLPTITDGRRARWAESAWSSSSGASPSVRRPCRAHSRISRTISSCRPWPVSGAATISNTVPLGAESVPTRNPLGVLTAAERLHAEGQPRAYTTRRRRLSSITRAPCRKVMGVPGQRWQAARYVASAS